MTKSIHHIRPLTHSLTSSFLAMAMCGVMVVAMGAGCWSVATADVLPSSTPTPDKEIRVGEFACMTGAMATYGITSNHAIQLAVEEINQKGGVLGLPLRVILEDDQSKAGAPAAAVKKLISNDKVIAVLGEYPSSFSLEAAPICEAAKIPMISPGTSAASLTEKGEYIFRVCFIDELQATAMARFALENLKAKNVAVLTAVNQDHSVEATKIFTNYLKKNGGKIVMEKSYSTGDKDFRAQLTAIKSVEPDAIFIPGYYTEGGLIARQARSLGLKVPLLGCDGWCSPKLIEIGGSAMDNSYFTSNFSADSPMPHAKEFATKFEAKFHTVPDEVAALAYDAVYLLADAIQRAGSTSEPALQKALADTKGFPGVTGTLTFDANRNPLKSAVILKVEDKDFKYVTTIAPEK